MKVTFNTFCAAALLFVAASSAHAQSQVTIYGIAAIETVRASNVASGSSVHSQTRVDNSQDTNSRLGLKGAEDLGGGSYALFGLEAGVGLDTGTVGSRFWGRGTYVGLRNDQWGTLTFGRQWNVNDDIMAYYFVFDGYAAFRFAEFDYLSDLVDNAVKYVSPEVAGFTFRALAAPGEGASGRTGEAALNYKNGGLNLAASYHNAKGANGQTDKLTSLGASLTVGDFRPHFGWSVSDSRASGLLKAKAYDIGLQWAATPFWTFGADYVARDQEGTDNDSHFIRLRGAYKLSKRTSLMANAITLRNKGTASERFYGDGAPGRGQNVFSVGMIHSF